MIDFLFSDMSIAIFVTAIIFTFYGKYISFKANAETVIAATIDSLIEEGYIKTRGSGKDLELLKHWE